MSRELEEHYRYLSDARRLRLFRRALQEAVRPGDVVLDLGSGTGILGLLACRAGARRVYAVETGGILERARAVCRANGLEDRIRFVQGLSTSIELPERVDLVVCDQLSGLGLDAGVQEYLTDARARFLKSGGRLIPSHLDLYLAPVACPHVHEQIAFWERAPAGFDFSPLRSWAVNSAWNVKLRRAQVLGAPAHVARVDLAVRAAKPLAMRALLRVHRRGRLHGLGGWFSARLSKRVRMTNSPLDAGRIERAQVFLPIETPVTLWPGDRIAVRLQVEPASLLLTWHLELRPRGGKGKRGRAEGRTSFTHSTFAGLALSREDLRKTLPGFRPARSRSGEAHLAVLSLCDGRTPLAEIERRVYRRLRRRFRAPEEAQALVAEVLRRHAR